MRRASDRMVHRCVSLIHVAVVVRERVGGLPLVYMLAWMLTWMLVRSLLLVCERRGIRRVLGVIESRIELLTRRVGQVG